MKTYWVPEINMVEEHSALRNRHDIAVFKADEVREVFTPILKSIGCSCAHSDVHSSQEWDRHHEHWCPQPKAQRLLARLK